MTESNAEAIVRRDHAVISGASRAHYFPLVMKGGQGATFTDADDKIYIDLFSSAAVLNTGHGHPNIVRAITDQAAQYIHFSTDYMYAEPQVDLAEALIRITPGSHAKKVCFGHSGSDAIDAAIKLARAYTRRPGIISFIGAYHGSTYGAITASAISLNMRRSIGPLLPGFSHMPYPDCYRCPMGRQKSECQLDCFAYLEMALRTFIPPEETAAILMEPIAGDIGFIEPPQSYMDALQALCRRHGILLIVDEVQQGMGRTGRWFSFEHFNLEPDLIVTGKALGSGLPISAVVARAEIVDALPEPAHLFTLQGNAVCSRAALATIQTIEEEGLVDQASAMGRYFKQRLEKMQTKYPLIGDIRGQGLSIGVELIKDPLTRERDREAAPKIVYECWKNGVVLIFLGANILRIQPPLVITRDEADRALDILEAAIDAYVRGVLPDDALTEMHGW